MSIYDGRRSPTLATLRLTKIMTRTALDFPYYDSLLAEVEVGRHHADASETFSTINRLIRTMDKKDSYELSSLTYAIIYHYWLLNGDKSAMFSLVAYGGNVTGPAGNTSVEYVASKLPPPLQVILGVMISKVCGG